MPERGGASPSPSRETVWTIWIVALVLLVAAVSVWRGTSEPPPITSRNQNMETRLEPTMIPLVTGEDSIQDQFVRAGCPVCHTIPGISGANGQVGPPLLLGTTGSERLADPAYKGRARTVREYIVESILSPGDYVVPGYPDKTMPAWYGSKLSAGALEQIAAYLEGLTKESTIQSH